jgi:hypothetical protein
MPRICKGPYVISKEIFAQQVYKDENLTKKYLC